MAKSIAFSADEMGELRAHYMQELSAAEERVKNIRAILSKIGSVPGKRGRKPSVKATDSSVAAESSAPKRRGRPRKNPVEIVPKKRGRKPKNAVAADVAPAPKRRGRPAKPKTEAAPALPKKRGRKPKAVVAAPVAPVTKGKRGRKPGSLNKKTIAAMAANAGKAPKAKAVKTPKSPKAVKVVKAPKAKAVKAPKLKVAKAPKAPKKIVAPKSAKVSKRDQYSSFITNFLGEKKQFFSTDEMIDAGIKAQNLKGKEKDAAKSTIQAVLNALAASGSIIRRKKDKVRMMFWAAPGVNDDGYLKA